MTNLKIALVQLCPTPLEAELNFRVATEHIRDASRQGADLVVLPEYHLSGWAPEDSQFTAIAHLGEQYLGRYQALAKELNINIVPGTILVTQSTTGGDIILNNTYFIDYDGRILGRYTKTNLWHPERPHLTSGPAAQKLQSQQACPYHTTIDTSIGRVGLLICYDLAFPEAFRALAKNGAQLIIIPTFTKADDMSLAARSYNPAGESLFTSSALITRAFENTCGIVFCNVGGEASDGYIGLSQVTMPITGPVEGSFSDSQVAMRIVEVDMKLLDIAEDNYKIRKDLAQPEFHY